MPESNPPPRSPANKYRLPGLIRDEIFARNNAGQSVDTIAKETGFDPANITKIIKNSTDLKREAVKRYHDGDFFAEIVQDMGISPVIVKEWLKGESRQKPREEPTTAEIHRRMRAGQTLEHIRKEPGGEWNPPSIQTEVAKAADKVYLEQRKPVPTASEIYRRFRAGESLDQIRQDANINPNSFTRLIKNHPGFKHDAIQRYRRGDRVGEIVRGIGTSPYVVKDWLEGVSRTTPPVEPAAPASRWTPPTIETETPNPDLTDTQRWKSDDPQISLEGMGGHSLGMESPLREDRREKKCPVCGSGTPMSGAAHCEHCESEFQERFGKSPSDVKPHIATRMWWAARQEDRDIQKGIPPADRRLRREKERQAFKEDRRRIAKEAKQMPNIDNMVLIDSLAVGSNLEGTALAQHSSKDAYQAKPRRERDPVAPERKLIDADLIARGIIPGQAFAGDRQKGRFYVNPRGTKQLSSDPDKRKSEIRDRLQKHVIDNRDSVIRRNYQNMDVETKELVQRELADGKIRPELSDYLMAKEVTRFNRKPPGTIPESSIDFPERDLDAETNRPRYTRQFYPRGDF